MLPLILGAVALGTVGYGVKKCLTDEDCIDNVKDKIQDTVFSLDEAMDRFSEKLGTNEVIVNSDGSMSYGKSTFFTDNSEKESKKTTKTAQTSTNKEFDTLYNLKQKIVEDIKQHDESFNEIKIKKDNLKDSEQLSEKTITNINSYLYILSSLHTKIKDSEYDMTNEKVSEYCNCIKKLCDTKIIKKEKLNSKSTDLIMSAMRLLLEVKEPIKVDLSGAFTEKIAS